MTESEWREVTLAEVCGSVDYGYTASATDDPDLPRFLRITDIVKPQIDWRSVPGCPIDAADLKKFALAKDDIVVARTGATVGYAKRIKSHPGAVFASYLVRFRPAECIVPGYLGAVVESTAYKEWVRGNAGGAAQPNANARVLGAYPFILPPAETQHKIARVSDAIGDLIENNRRRAEMLEEMARTIYREWFAHFRFPGHEDASFVDTAVGLTPEGWEVQVASKALQIKPRLRVDRDTEHPFITMGDVSEARLWCSASERKAGSSGAKFQNWDTLFARITPCLENGKTALVLTLNDDEVGRGSTEFIVLRGNAVGPVFTYCLARSDDFRGHAIASMSGASGRQRVRDECFDSYLLAVPPRELADEFEARTVPLIQMIKKLSEASDRLAGIRDVVLPKLVTGQIDVSDLDLDAIAEQASV